MLLRIVLFAALLLAAAAMEGKKAVLGKTRLVVQWKDRDHKDASRGEKEKDVDKEVPNAKRIRDTQQKWSIFELDKKEDGKGTEKALKSVRKSQYVAGAQEDLQLAAALTPTDPYYAGQWNLQGNTGPSYGMNLPGAWDVTTGAGVTIAIIDTGIWAHEDLGNASHLIPGYDMVSLASISNDNDGRDADASDPGDYSTGVASDWHGTHTAGIAAAVMNNGKGIAGVAPDAKVMPLRFIGAGVGYASDLMDSITWAVGASVSGAPANPNAARVLSISASGNGTCPDYLQTAINTAYAAQAVVVVAAGNDGEDAALHFPGNCDHVIAVGAHTKAGALASYSNYGSTVDILAPGGDGSGSVMSTINTGTTTPIAGGSAYAAYSGTSMATPHVTGLAALLLSVQPSLTPDAVEAAIKATALPFPAAGCSTAKCGAGLADATKAVYYILKQSPPLALSPSPSPASTYLAGTCSGIHDSHAVDWLEDTPNGCNYTQIMALTSGYNCSLVGPAECKIVECWAVLPSDVRGKLGAGCK